MTAVLKSRMLFSALSVSRSSILRRSMASDNAGKKALVIIADGSEESEAVITIDVLRRAGVQVTVAGLLSEKAVKCAQETKIQPDAALSFVQNQKFDAIILPGGEPGSTSFAKSDEIGVLLRSQFDAKRLVGAICAAPIALQSHGIAPGIRLTCHPTVQKKLTDAGYKFVEEPVVASDNIVTSRGPGTAFKFGLKLAEMLVGAKKAEEIQEPMMLKC